MRRSLPLFLTIVTLTGTACTGATVDSDQTSSEETQSSSAVQEVRNVSYQGVIEAGGMSIYMEGTHQLRTDNGRTVLLESDTLTLDRYVGKSAIILGAVRPSVEGDAVVMRVEQITLLEPEATSSAAAEEESSASSAEEAVSSAQVSSTAPAVSSAPARTSSVGSKASVLPASSKPASSAVSSSKAAVSSVAQAVSSAPRPISNPDETQQMAAAMAKANMAAGNWTQQYCTSHIGFCFPVHKNWWFHSFGTTTTNLWHVEIGTQAIDELGDGPLVVNLVSGSVSAEGVSDGQISTQGDFVVGYKAWTDNRHFEVSAPKVLESAVRYILENIKPQS